MAREFMTNTIMKKMTKFINKLKDNHDIEYGIDTEDTVNYYWNCILHGKKFQVCIDKVSKKMSFSGDHLGLPRV